MSVSVILRFQLIVGIASNNLGVYVHEYCGTFSNLTLNFNTTPIQKKKKKKKKKILLSMMLSTISSLQYYVIYLRIHHYLKAECSESRLRSFFCSFSKCL